MESFIWTKMNSFNLLHEAQFVKSREIFQFLVVPSCHIYLPNIADIFLSQNLHDFAFKFSIFHASISYLSQQKQTLIASIQFCLSFDLDSLRFLEYMEKVKLRYNF